jgi:putative oxygen-independent coproporphyrinogen III oxidase
MADARYTLLRVLARPQHLVVFARCGEPGLLAQLAEQLTLNQRVVGSSPTRPTRITPVLDGGFAFGVGGQVGNFGWLCATTAPAGKIKTGHFQRTVAAVSTSLPTIQHLYIHVPFCPTICPYCDFHVLTRQSGLVEAYLRELRHEAQALAAAFQPQLQTLYLGGGTPSFLRDHEMVALVDTVREHFAWVPDRQSGGEATIEVNPGTVNSERVKLWRELGFDRASLGVQSLNTEVLRFLGRSHSPGQALAAIELLKNAGFRVSADLITAVPGQNIGQDIHQLAATGLDHLSAYTLTIEEGTEFARRGITVAGDDEIEALELAEVILSSYGLARYEVSNHAKAGAQSRHNLAYWHNRFYYGLGPAASGHYPVDNRADQAKTDDLIAYRAKNPPLSGWLLGQRGEHEPVNRLDFATDALFSGLRLTSGVNLSQLSAQAGFDLANHFSEQIDSLGRQALLQYDGEILRATPAGLWVLNQVVAEFL